MPLTMADLLLDILAAMLWGLGLGLVAGAIRRRATGEDRR